MSGKYQLMAKLLYGSGLRLMECIRLRIKDIDFGQHQVIVRAGKGLKDRITVLPDAAVRDLHRHLRHVKLLFEDDLANDFSGVSLPYALAVLNTPVRNLSGNGSMPSHPRTSPGIHAAAN